MKKDSDPTDEMMIEMVHDLMRRDIQELRQLIKDKSTTEADARRYRGNIQWITEQLKAA